MALPPDDAGAAAAAAEGARPSVARGVVARALRLAGLLLCVVALFALLLTLVFAIPSGRIARNVKASVPLLRSEGVYPRLLFDSPAYQLDNTTDSLMLDIALGEPGLGPFRSAMAAYYGVHVAGEGTFDPIEVLAVSATGRRAHQEAYARYWHGYQVALRPALYLFSLDDLRRVNGVALAVLALSLLAMLWVRVRPAAAIAVACGLVLSGFAIAPLSLQYSGMTYLSLLGMVAVALLGRFGLTSEGDLELFLVLGATTALVDLLTTPLLALGLPLGVALALRGRTAPDARAREDLVFAARAVAAWGLGYVGAWAAKWALGSLVLGGEVTGSAVRQAQLWVGGRDAVAVAVEAVKVNVMNLLPWVRFDPALTGPARYLSIGPTGIVLGALAVAAVVLLARCRRPAIEVRRAAVVLLLVPMVYAWLMLFGPHSKLHYAYTYRVQAVVVFAVVYFIVASVDWARLRPGSPDRGLLARDG